MLLSDEIKMSVFVFRFSFIIFVPFVKLLSPKYNNNPFGSLCYAIRTFDRLIKLLESFLPMSYALLAGRP